MEKFQNCMGNNLISSLPSKLDFTNKRKICPVLKNARLRIYFLLISAFFVIALSFFGIPVIEENHLAFVTFRNNQL